MLLNAIISRQLSGSACARLLAGDGVTTPDLSVKGARGIYEPASVDVRSAKKTAPSIGEAASVAKNLDEYQFLICSLVPSLPDSNPAKMELQKRRVAIVAAFAKLVPLLQKQGDLSEWNVHAKKLLEETSEAYVKAKSNAKLEVTRHKDAYEFFDVPEDRLDAALRAAYGQT